MGNIVLTMQISLDGIVSDEDQWMTLSEEILQDYLEYYQTVDTIIVGSNSYSSLARYWEQAEHSSDSLERAIAKRINEIPKVVISRSEVDVIWRNSQQLVVKDAHSLQRELEQLKTRANKISVESGVKTWQLFIQNDLFDELWLLVHPVIVSRGERLFALAEKQSPLHLRSTKAYQNGVVGLYYQK
ncbi:dihydrofolate reductase family protein [Brevibacillus humidisoli]|uniref:dihydrofolate reductase family protein n=1 Tax=Brevibacillus humidisoli TaxID=2895522 RepID=UPI001E4907EA|nr:dihydrofolate reductase family protein [Brevibacillus humidisoli]UFJ41723.1 dihydrofolate reductase family protein [Brevibacillus humidisoli]